MKPVNCLIIDDEPLARDIIETFLLKVPGWSVVQSCKNAGEAYEALIRHQVDVIFLDISMPVMSGIEFLRSLKNAPVVIFTTAYPHYAVDGFELRAADYLLKPFTQDRFMQAIEKAQEKLVSKSNKVSEAIPGPEYFFVRQDARLVKVLFDEVLFLEAQRDFTTIYLKTKKLLAGMHLKMFEDQLPATRFIRVHRSFMINIEAIKALQGNMLEIGEHEIPVGPGYKDELFKILRLP